MLQDPKLAEEFEANEMHEDDGSMDEADASSPKNVERLVRPKRKGKIKENKCTSHSCSSIKNDQWLYEQQEGGESSKMLDKVICLFFFLLKEKNERLLFLSRSIQLKNLIHHLINKFKHVQLHPN